MKLNIDGRSAYVGTLGRDVDPSRPAVVFVHGAAMDHSVWTPFCRHLVRHGFNALALDLPGHGRSSGPALAEVGALANWVARVLEATGHTSPTVVGHSMGALVALDLAARFPERVGNLALLGVSAPMPVAEMLLGAAREDRHLGLDLVNLWGLGPRAHLGGYSVPGIWMSGSVLRLLERAAPGVLHADLTACNDYAEGLERAAAVRCRTQLVLGGRDAMTPPRAARALESALGQAAAMEKVVLERCGHLMMIEQPNETLDALRGFLAADATRAA